MSDERHFYGYRFFYKNYYTNREGELMVFTTREDRDRWVSYEEMSLPSHLGGGKRIACTRKKAIDLAGHATLARKLL